MSLNYNWRLSDHTQNSLGAFDTIITQYKPDQKWKGRVLVHYLNKKDLELVPKMISHNNGLIITYNRTETRPFQQLLIHATGMVILNNRLRFTDDQTGMIAYDNAPYGNVIFSFSEYDNNAIKNSGMGVFIPLKI